MITTLVGIDPGVIHTGIIVSKINPHVKEVTNSTFLMEGCPVMDIRDILRNFRPTATFIEGYRPRSNLHHDRQMQKFVSDLNFHLRNSIALDNMDSKNVVKNDLLKLFKLYSFSTRSHHQDLRSAARIMLFGALKQNDTNALIADVVRDTIKTPGSWDFTTK